MTIRTFLRRLTRLALDLSKKLSNLEAAIHLHMAYYNFLWRPAPLGGITPTMAAGVIRKLRRFEEMPAA